jgi:hypothetical protein
LGKFWQFWAEFAALIVAKSMLEAMLKSLKHSNSSIVNPNATWSISLESYHPYLQPQKVSKNPQTYCVHNTLPKSTKSHFGYFRPLKVNGQMLPFQVIFHRLILRILPPMNKGCYPYEATLKTIFSVMDTKYSF